MKVTAALLLLVLVWPGSATSALAQASPTAPSFTLKKVAEGLYAAINPDGGKAGRNAGFVVGKDSVLVVDTIIAQTNVRAWERTENLKFFGPDPKPEQKQRVESLALPTLVYDGGALTLD